METCRYRLSFIKSSIQSLDDENKDVRIRAPLVLGLLKDKEAFAPLVKSLSDRDNEVRASVVKALAYIGNRGTSFL